MDRLAGLRVAPGAPGIPPRWFSSRKDAVGSSPLPSRQVWFTIGEGVLDEVYYPRVDDPCTRHMECLVADRRGFYSEERRDTVSRVSWLEPGVPVFTVENEARCGAYRLRKEVVADPDDPVVLQRIALESSRPGLSLFALLVPHLDDAREPNDAWVADYRGIPMLFARAGGDCLAFAAAGGWKARTVGYARTSDGRETIRDLGGLDTTYGAAPAGNVALTGEAPLDGAGRTVLAVGFGGTPEEAAFHVRRSLDRGFDAVRDAMAAAWRRWQKKIVLPGAALDAAVLHCHG
ncbi:MAG TPA: hypothetical protein VIM58_11480, partial [Candidatus Methylacidiphilales bacterium]